MEDYDRKTTIPVEGDDPKTYKAFQRALGRVILSVALKVRLFISLYHFSLPLSSISPTRTKSSLSHWEV